MGQGCLFGWEHDPNKGGRGRPAHVPNKETRNKIKLLLALGWSQGRIAAAVGITEPTLRKHYFSLLKVRDLARDAMMARRFERVWAQAEAGNIGAERLLSQMIEDNDRMVKGRELREDDGQKADAPLLATTQKADGKKAKQQADADNLIGADPDLGAFRLN